MSLIAIIIPCYNEELRLLSREITGFLADHDCYHFILVDDGSTDQTGAVINDLIKTNPSQVFKLTLEKNQGKANAVRQGLLHTLLQKKYELLGYWDADLSTSLQELLRLTKIMQDQKLEFVFGSRIKKLNASIQRSGFRHIVGRMITTLIDTHFNLGIYDTQCGAKIFSASLAGDIFNEPFVTKWLFDVEIFLRIRDLKVAIPGKEVSLHHWKSRSGSKITVLDAPGLLFQFIKLVRTYPAKKKGNG